MNPEKKELELQYKWFSKQAEKVRAELENFHRRPARVEEVNMSKAEAKKLMLRFLPKYKKASRKTALTFIAFLKAATEQKEMWNSLTVPWDLRKDSYLHTPLSLESDPTRKNSYARMDIGAFIEEGTLEVDEIPSDWVPERIDKSK